MTFAIRPSSTARRLSPALILPSRFTGVGKSTLLLKVAAVLGTFLMRQRAQHPHSAPLRQHLAQPPAAGRGAG